MVRGRESRKVILRSVQMEIEGERHAAVWLQGRVSSTRSRANEENITPNPPDTEETR